jgi:uncharacterized protein
MIEELKRALGPVFEKGKDKIVAVYLFGSGATGDFGPTSDIDLAVLLDEEFFAAADQIKIDVYLDCSRALKRNDIDVIVMNRTRNIILLDEVVRNGIVLFEANSGVREEFEVKVMHDCIDFRQHRMEAQRAHGENPA